MKKSSIFGMYFIRLILHQIGNILEGLLDNRPEAMKHMFDLFYQPLCFYAIRYVRSTPVAEEIVSDVMFKIWQNRRQSYRPETFHEYLYTATRNTALNYLKQEQNQRKLSDEWAENLRGELIEETPLDKMITEEVQAELKSLMNTLPEQCRKAFLMSRIDNMSYEEIATQMDISPNTVKYHIKTALQKLRAGVGSILVFLLFLLGFFWIIFAHIPILFLFSIVYSIPYPIMLIMP